VKCIVRQELSAGAFSFADIAFHMAQIFGARKGAPITSETPYLLTWRSRMTARPAVRKVAGAMATYLASIKRPIPDFLEGLS
jgi:glutathione S-transferase